MNLSRTFRAPGRVNLIGEHTDYNLGFVLPVALDLATTVESSPSDDGRLHIVSREREDIRSVPVAEIRDAAPARHWSDYVVGVARELAILGFEIPALRLSIESNVPEGAGLSSSAALEVATALALLHGRCLPPLELARLCQRAESGFAGMPCGIMDQYVSVFGEAGSALCIDCRSLESAAVSLPRNIAIVAVNSMVKHHLGDSAYRIRVGECQEAASSLGVASLRDATPEQLPALNGTILKRARHIVSENARVLGFVEAARVGDLRRMGQMFVESHASMRDDYEITCTEIDYLAAEALGIDGCYGARMTGGGFGGCTVNLVDPQRVTEFAEELSLRYRATFGLTPEIYRCEPSGGAKKLSEKE